MDYARRNKQVRLIILLELLVSRRSNGCLVHINYNEIFTAFHLVAVISTYYSPTWCFWLYLQIFDPIIDGIPPTNVNNNNWMTVVTNCSRTHAVLSLRAVWWDKPILHSLLYASLLSLILPFWIDMRTKKCILHRWYGEMGSFQNSSPHQALALRLGLDVGGTCAGSKPISPSHLPYAYNLVNWSCWKILRLRVQLKVHGFNNLTHSRFTSIAGFNYGLVVMMTNSRSGSHGQDHLLTSLLMQLHHGPNMLTDNSQSLLYDGSRISPRALSLFVSGFVSML